MAGIIVFCGVSFRSSFSSFFTSTFMKQQSVKSHAQYVPGFHFMTFGLVLLSLATAIYAMIKDGVSVNTVFYLLVALCLGGLFAFTRVFATGNQDRVIRAEENFRSYRLSGKPLDERLSRTQVIALRFADDDEYLELVSKAIRDNMSPADIKAAIQRWRADNHRV
jgi:hypothetical protein